MNNDILPCWGLQVIAQNAETAAVIECQKRDTCLHYAQWLKENALGREILSHINPQNCIKENYKLYMEDNK